MNLREGIGFGCLSHQEQQLYKAMLKAFSSMATSFACPKISNDVDLMKVLNAALGDNPSVVYFDKTKIETEKSILGKQIFLTGVYPKHQVEKMNAALDTTVNKIAASVKNVSHDEYSLLINLYEKIQKNIRYDNAEAKANSRGTSINPASHNTYGAIINKTAVCDGFSSAFSLLAQKLGFECTIIVGRSAYSSTQLTAHAWNIINIRNKYYHVDSTWDTRQYNEFDEFSYNYFAVTDKEIAHDHDWNNISAFVCSNDDFSYYIKHGLFANNTEQLKEIVKAFGRKNSNVFRIKLSHNIDLPKNAGDYLVQMVLNEVVKPGQRKQASYSWNENIRCFLAKII